MTDATPAYAGRVKYTEERSRKYQNKPPRKHAAEMKLIDRAFALIPKTHRVLDAPCGGGRVAIHLAQQGYQVTAADLSAAMVKVAGENFARAGLPITVEQQDVEQLGFPDQAFDTIVSFRLFHHFPDCSIRERVARELCRVARQNVVLSYFNPVSFTSARNKLRSKLAGRPPKKYTTSLREVTGYFRACGFWLVKDFAQTPVIHTLHVAVFARAEATRL